MKSVFCRLGVPKEIVCDHVPFSSYEMHDFASSWGIELTHSSPRYPQSNGLAERMVKTVKQVIKKAQQTGTDPLLAFLTLRNTPVTGMEYSPAQLLMGRVLRSTLPSSSSILQPAVPQKAHSALQDLQKRQQRYYNRGTKRLPNLFPGDTVHMETAQGWRPAVVTEERSEHRSYNIVSSSGQHYRRNRRHLRKTPVCTQATSDADLVDVDLPGSTGTSEAEIADSQSLSTQAPTHTRSGRVIGPPERFKDFQMGRH
ncbi:uncharacterized protein LOC120555860 [Perca fluviatilis]|uniref:uncharacterized protein LOC120555860 n=1 Tax=Perca fluviatilis TaxID=8168 RepID=UPI001966076B|nr:uncharacterized protein LOC120555860 [Perca fluviatilis]